MIKYLKQADIDYDKWDTCIDKAINSYVYAYSWYLDIVAGDWDALVEDDYERVFPLPFRSKMGIKYIYQPIFSQQLGLFSKSLGSKEQLQDFLSTIPNSFKLIELNINKFHIPALADGAEISENLNIELELAKDYQSIAENYSTNLKRNIKKAQKNGLQIIPQIKPEELINLFQKNKGAEISAYSQEDYTRLGRLIYKLLDKGLAKIYSVGSAENNLLASALFVKSNKRYIFLFSGLADEGKQKAAMPFLINQFIQDHSNSDFILDFEGSNDANLARFYQSFGADKYSYYSYHKMDMPFWMKTPMHIYKKFRK